MKALGVPTKSGVFGARMAVSLDNNGPVTLILGEANDEMIERIAAITVRYSDAPRDTPVEVECTLRGAAPILAKAIDDGELEGLIRAAVRAKWVGHRINHDDFEQPARSISMIGG